MSVGGRNLRATDRPSRRSSARYTSPMPPAPSSAVISYDPKRAPTVSDMNAVAVIDVAEAKPELEGYVAAGWYPSSVLASPDGKRLLIANA